MLNEGGWVPIEQRTSVDAILSEIYGERIHTKNLCQQQKQKIMIFSGAFLGIFLVHYQRYLDFSM